MNEAGAPIKVVDNTTHVRSKVGKAVIREEVWTDANGALAKYNLAFIDHSLCQKDNGRVLGYDNSHGKHHRHYMGKVSEIEFDSYDALLARFIAEVAKLREQE